jgi:beta-N-acetylhexosaminidase
MDIDMDLAPVLDVASDPRNTVIGDRSYGPDPRAVARLGGAYIRGLQAGGVIATGKHFPGHGDTRVDSHLALPVLPFGRRRLDAVELVPFRRAIAPRVDAAAIMVGHLALPKLDPTGSPATLSAPIVTGLLRDDLGYDGLVITDDLGAMAAITSRYPPGVAAVRAIRAGVDMLIIVRSGRNQVRARDALLRALASGRLDRERVVASVRRILMVKARFGLLDGVRPAPVACDALPGADRAGGADATG